MTFFVGEVEIRQPAVRATLEEGDCLRVEAVRMPTVGAAASVQALVGEWVELWNPDDAKTFVLTAIDGRDDAVRVVCALDGCPLTAAYGLENCIRRCAPTGMDRMDRHRRF